MSTPEHAAAFFAGLDTPPALDTPAATEPSAAHQYAARVMSDAMAPHSVEIIPAGYLDTLRAKQAQEAAQRAEEQHQNRYKFQHEREFERDMEAQYLGAQLMDRAEAQRDRDQLARETLNPWAHKPHGWN